MKRGTRLISGSAFRIYPFIIFALIWLASCSSEPLPADVGPASPSAARTSAKKEDAAPTPSAVVEEEVEAVSTSLPAELKPFWWNETVFYEIFVRSFQDSDGDGVGDIVGLIDRLDYLNDGDPNTNGDLGISGIWLMPITESPSYHGYDVVDYIKVDEEYGTEEEFKQLVQEAHARGIYVIIDFVMNHTSRDHPWFQEGRDSDSALREWYVWSDEDPGYNGSWGQQVWHFSGGDYYYGVFWEGMPDLNFENPEVTEAMLEAARFWLEDMGADGFRLDAVKHIIEDGPQQENTPATHAWLEGFFEFYKGVSPYAFTVGEAWTSTDQVLEYTGDEVDIAFQFDLADAILDTSEQGLSTFYTNRMMQIVGSFPAGQYATFITNHDQNRVMSQLLGDEEAAKVAASLLLTSPGVPFIYYGEEIGMTGTKPDEDIRRPMQWSGDSYRVGFTSGTPWRGPAKDFDERNVEVEAGDAESLLNHYRALISLRNNHAAMRTGEWMQVRSGHTGIAAFLRHTDNEYILVLINTSRDAVAEYSLDLNDGPLSNGMGGVLLFGDGTLEQPEINESGGFNGYKPFEVLQPQSTYIIELRN